MLILKLLALCYTLGLTFPLSALISYVVVRLLKVIFDPTVGIVLYCFNQMFPKK